MLTEIIAPGSIKGEKMSQIKDVLFRNIEKNIAPVIYFHQLEPDVAAQEVGEYIFTTRPASQGNQLGGIHEQMVSLLNQISIAIEEGHKLPASWISGFFGSGKSSFENPCVKHRECDRMFR